MASMMRPSELRFTQDSIDSTFSNGNDINTVINKIALLSGESRLDAMRSFLPLTVGRCRNDGRLYCNDNRRLYLFRVMERRGYVNQISVAQGSLRPKSHDVGCHVRMRGGYATPHCPCQ